MVSQGDTRHMRHQGDNALPYVTLTFDLWHVDPEHVASKYVA